MTVQVPKLGGWRIGTVLVSLVGLVVAVAWFGSEERASRRREQEGEVSPKPHAGHVDSTAEPTVATRVIAQKPAHDEHVEIALFVVRGVVELAREGARSAAFEVRAVERHGMTEIARVEKRETAFELLLPRERSAPGAYLIARSMGGDERWVTHPKPILVSAAGVSPEFVRLTLMRGREVRGRVVDANGGAVPGAVCLLSQLSLATTGRRIPAGEIDVRRTLDERIVAGPSGEILATVREGHFELRASRDGRVFGASVRHLAVGGGAVDAGILRVPRAATRLSLAVTDLEAKPLPGIVLRLPDRALRFGSDQAKDDLAHVVTDSNGPATLEVDEAVLPLRGAVGSRRYHCAEVVWEVPADEVRMELAPRPQVDLVLRAPTGEIVPIEDAPWHVEHAERRPAMVDDEGPCSPLQVLRMHRDVHTDEAASPGVTRITLAAPGAYRFSAELPGGARLRAEAAIHTGRMEIPVVARGLRRVEILLRNRPPREIDIEIVSTGRAGSGGRSRSRVTSGPDAERVVCWVPESAEALDLRCEEPWCERSVDASRSPGHVEFDLASSETNCHLRVEGIARAPGAFVIQLPSGRLRRVAADSPAGARVRLRPGEYHAAWVAALDLAPAGWRRFALGDGETAVVTWRANPDSRRATASGSQRAAPPPPSSLV